MKCTILHESKGRLRVRMRQYRMTLDQADILEYYLRDLSAVTKVKVYDRTCDAVIYFRAGRKSRDSIVHALSLFHYEDAPVTVPDQTGRKLQRQFEDKLFYHVAERVVTRWFLPLPVRMVLTTVKSIPYLIKGIRSLGSGKLQVPLLDAVSIGVSIARGDFDTAGSVMFLLKLGDIMEDYTYRKSVDDLARTMSLNVEKVWIRDEDGQEVLKEVSSVTAGEQMIVRTGNMIPLDGTVLSGDASVNQASITGEPLPAAKSAGSSVYSGTVVEEGQLLVAVKNTAGTGRYDRIVQMIEESEKLKSTSEMRASELADRLVPYTFGATLLTLLISRNVTRATSILMVDFCCALKLSMPIAVLSAMREAGDHSITVKGGRFMEAVAEADTIVFDKTGTLTKASPKVKEIVPFDGRNEAEMLRLAACLEEHFPHSIANAVVQEAARRGLSHKEMHAGVEYIVAHGIASSINGQKVRIGSYHFLFEDEGIALPADPAGKELFHSLPDEYSPLYLSIGDELAAVILIEDPLKEETASVVRSLHELGISNVVMLTGDSYRTARAVAKKVGVDSFRAEVLPEDKAAFIQEEHKAGRKVIMVGDGINDSPALSEADAGIAINSGAAIAREVSDIMIAEDDLASLLTLRRVASGLMKRINGNYRFILGFNSGLILLGMFGILTPNITALLHNGSTIALSLHSMTELLPEDKA